MIQISGAELTSVARPPRYSAPDNLAVRQMSSVNPSKDYRRVGDDHQSNDHYVVPRLPIKDFLLA